MLIQAQNNIVWTPLTTFIFLVTSLTVFKNVTHLVVFAFQRFFYGKALMRPASFVVAGASVEEKSLKAMLTYL